MIVMIGLLIIFTVACVLAVLHILHKREKRTEQYLAQAERYRQIVESCKEGIYVTDTERRIIYWNRAAEELTGYRYEEVRGMPCKTVISHEDLEGRVLCEEGCPLKKAMETKSPAPVIVSYLKHRDGEKIPVEVSVSPLVDEKSNVVGCIEVFHNVTDRLTRERALTEKTRTLQAVLESIKDGVLFLDPSGRVNLYNTAFKNLFDIKQDITGRYLYEISDGRFLRTITEIEKLYRGQRCYEMFQGECPEEEKCVKEGACRCWLYRRTHGCNEKISTRCRECAAFRQVKAFLENPLELEIGDRHISVVSSFIESEKSDEIWEVIVFRDVTEVKRDAVVKLAAAAAHELRQPMQAIIGAVELLAENMDDDGKKREYMNVIIKSCYRMDAIIDDIARITRYRLKEYSKDISIVDIRASSERGPSKEDTGEEEGVKQTKEINIQDFSDNN